jgi:hypothetical protein
VMNKRVILIMWTLKIQFYTKLYIHKENKIAQIMRKIASE